MPTDYKPREKKQQKKPFPGYLWLLAGLLIGLFVAFIVYLDKQPATTTPFSTAVKQELKEIKQAKKAAQPQPQQVAEDEEPKYNFYTILQGMKVLIPESETRPPEPVKTNEAGSQEKSYILQAGSFQNLNDAERLKARLAFLGIEADIQHVTVNQQAWHRVRTGPYQDKQQLYINQKILQENNIIAISMEHK